EAGLRIEKTVFIPDPTSDRVSSLTLYGVYTVGGDAGVRQLTGCTAYGVLDNSPGESGWNGFYCIDGTGRYPDRRASVRAVGVMEYPTQVRVGHVSYTHYARVRTDRSLRYELLSLRPGKEVPPMELAFTPLIATPAGKAAGLALFAILGLALAWSRR